MADPVRPVLLKDANYNSVPILGTRQAFSKTLGTAASPVNQTFSPADNAGYTDTDANGNTLLMEPNQLYEISLTKLAGATTNNSLINIYMGKTDGSYVTNPMVLAIFSGTVFIQLRFGASNDRIKIERFGSVTDDVQVGIRKLQ